jgi:adenosylhomocysteinase
MLSAISKKISTTDLRVKLGHQKVLTASMEMPGLSNLINYFAGEKPLDGAAILGCVTLTPQTAVFIFTLRELGAELSWCSDNPYASDPDVLAYLKASNFKVFAEHNMSLEEYYKCMVVAAKQLKEHHYVQIHDDGCDMTRYLSNHHPYFLKNVWGITEQTTCGISFLTNLYRQEKLFCPSIDIAHGFMKKFDNFFGLQQSLLHSLTNIGITIASKKVTVIGYGPVGEGSAKALRSLGASVSIVEHDISKLAKAYFEGFIPRSIEEALSTSDMVLSATGCLLTINGEMINNFAKDGLILGNIGHGREEYDILWLEKNCTRDEINQFRTVFFLADGRKIYSLCDGALVNFLAGSGNPSLELSLTFTAVALAQIELLSTRHGKKYEVPQIYPLSTEIDELCARLNFPELVPKLYCLSKAQKHYLAYD